MKTIEHPKDIIKRDSGGRYHGTSYLHDKDGSVRNISTFKHGVRHGFTNIRGIDIKGFWKEDIRIGLGINWIGRYRGW